MKNEQIITPQLAQTTPDNTLEMDISSVKSLQIGYHAETIFLHKTEGKSLILKEYIGGLSGSEYYAKVSANRIKTTIRYGRREEVNHNTYVEVFLPESWHGELSLSSQYGHITTEDDWIFDRFASETGEGAVTLKTITSPRIRISTPASPIQIDHSIGFTDLHSVSGNIIAKQIDGGAKLETSSSIIYAAFSSLNNIVECNTLNGNIELVLPKDAGMKVDGISKTGNITSEIEGLEVKTKPGNIKNIVGTLGSKPFQNVRISTINGDVLLRY